MVEKFIINPTAKKPHTSLLFKCRNIKKYKWFKQLRCNISYIKYGKTAIPKNTTYSPNYLMRLLLFYASLD